jgi:hypothetical protein
MFLDCGVCLGCGIIGVWRTNTARLRQPWRAILRYHARLFSVGAPVPRQAVERRTWLGVDLIHFDRLQQRSPL